MVLVGAAEPDPADIQFFESRVRPILAENCYKCHSHQAEKLESELSGHTYRIGIKTKDIFDNIQMHNIQFHFITPESNQVAYAMTLSLVIAKVV